MVKEIFIKFLGILFVVFVISVSCTKTEQIEPLSYARIVSLDRSLLYDQIAAEFSSYPWDREEDPRMFMIYCKAIVESKSKLPSFLKHPSLPTYKSEFVQGYFNLLQGELKEALKGFITLTENQDGRVWGYIGLLEFALYTEGITSMKELLEMLRVTAERNPSSVPSWSIPRYSAWYHYYSGEFGEVDKIISKYNKEIPTVESITLRVYLLIRENRFEDAEKVIKKLSPELLIDQHIIDLEAEIVRLRYGNYEWLKHLYEKFKRFPYMHLIEQRYAEALIDNGQIKDGIKMLKKLAKKRPFDITLQLTLAENLLYFEKDKSGAKNIFLFMGKKLTWDSQYYYLMAKIYHAQRQEEKLQKVFKKAKEFHPKNTQFLSLMFTFAMEKHDYYAASNIIQELLELEPNDISVLVSLMELSYFKGDWKNLFATEKKLEQSPRFIDEKTWNEVKSYKALALVSLHKYSDAQKTLGEIKDVNVRMKTASEIEKIRLQVGAK